MKTIIFSTFLLLAINTKSQILYFIPFVDSENSKRDFAKACRNDFFDMQDCFKTIATGLKYEYKLIDCVGFKFTTESFDNVLKRFSPTNKDIVILYCSSHGARSESNRTDFPEIDITQVLKNVYEKHIAIKKLPHKTLFTIIDACNDPAKIKATQTLNFKSLEIEAPVTTLNTSEIANAKNIFISNNFDAIVTSSQKGVTSISTSNGGVFSHCFIESLSELLSSNKANLNVLDILTKSYDNTLSETKRIYVNNADRVQISAEHQPHYPVWELKRTGGGIIFKSVEDATSFKIIYSKPEKTRWHIFSGKYKVDIKISADSVMRSKIKEVRYFFDPDTFKRPEDVATDKDNMYKYRLYIYGEFVIRAKITLEDGEVIDINKDLLLPNGKSKLSSTGIVED